MRLSRLSGVVAALMLAALAAGCSSQQAARFASLNAAPGNATIAFESIDGPPPEVFRKLVAALNDEAGARRVAVVSRSGPATYRIRGYVSAMVDRGKTSFAWVWDVYDSDKRRALRITGEEPGATAARRHDARAKDAWSAADDEVLRRISRTGMERLAAFLNSPGQPPAAAPEPTLPVLVAGRDDSPEAAGIFRILGGSGQQAAPPPEPEAETPKPAAQPARERTQAKRRSAAATPTTLDQ
ncbi:MAG: hypothetical protein K2Z80_32440 [Xanthobacteraceae bacterium]|nr:hypothetical protein [Xanthobacteraceae bacterium]